MANLKSSIKRVRTSEHKTEVNKAQRSKVRTYLKKARLALEDGDEDAEKLVKETIKVLDRAATKGVISKHKAARHKSELTTALNAKKEA